MLNLETLIREQANAAFFMARQGVEESIEKVIVSNLPTVEDLQAGQMFAGELSDGTEIVPDYTKITKRIKRSKGQPFDRVTLRDKGAFHQKIKAIYDAPRFSIFIDSTDVKSQMLKMKYSRDIFGLNDTFLDGLRISIEDETITQTCKDFENA